MDRLDWAVGLSAISFGVRLGVRVDDPRLLPKLAACLPPGWREQAEPVVDNLYSIRAGGGAPGSRVRRFYVGYNGATRFIRTLEEPEALALFESSVRLEVATRTDEVFVHAGAVGWRGRAIVIPAPSTYGKSRLVEALVRAGADYYSDEFAVLDESGRVLPFAKPLTLRSKLERWPSKIVEITARHGSAPLPIGLIVSTRYEPGCEWQPRVGSAAEAVLALIGNAIRARIVPGPTLKTLARAVEPAVFLEGPRGEADAAAREILERLA